MDTKSVNKAPLDVSTSTIGSKKNIENVEAQKNGTQISGRNVTHHSAVEVDLSNSAKALADAHAKAFEIAKGTPDVNEARVAELKERINNGTYQIDAGGIADGILREAVLDKLAETER